MRISTQALRHADDAVSKAISKIAETADIESELLDHLNASLAEGVDCTDENAKSQRGTVSFLDYLWRTKASTAASVAQAVPLIAANKKVVRWGQTRLMMAPVLAWGEAARPFAAAYPSERVLDDVYLTTEVLVSALVSWGIAIADPISRSTPPELDGQRLAGMVTAGFDSSGITVRGEEFSEIALLA